MKKPLIQLSFDYENFEEKNFAYQWASYVDILEIAKSRIQPWQYHPRNLKAELNLAQNLKNNFPDTQVMVEIMTADDAELFYKAGVDICIISGNNNLKEIDAVMNVAKQYNAEVQVNLSNKFSARQAVELGANIVGVGNYFGLNHIAKTNLREIINQSPVKISIASNLNESINQTFARTNADILAINTRSALSNPTLLNSLHTLIPHTEISEKTNSESDLSLYVQLTGDNDNVKGRSVKVSATCRLIVDFCSIQNGNVLFELTGDELKKAKEEELEVGFVLYRGVFKLKDNISHIKTRFTDKGFETPVEFELTAPERKQDCKLWLEMTISERPAIRIPIVLEVVTDFPSVSENVPIEPVKLNIDKMIRQAQKRTAPLVILRIDSSDDAYAELEIYDKRTLKFKRKIPSKALTLTSLANQLGSYAEKMRRVSEDTVWNLLSNPMEPNAQEKEWLKKSLATTADVGSRLYNWLVNTAGIKELLDQIDKLKPSSLILVHSDGVAIPWEIIYPEFYLYDPAKNEIAEAVDTRKFWGTRFLFETNLTPSQRDLPSGDVDLVDLHRNSAPNLTVVLNNEIDNELTWKAQPPVLYQKNTFNINPPRLKTACNDVTNLFTQDAATGSLIYFFCHGGAEQAFNPIYPEVLQITNGCQFEADELNCDVIYRDAPIVFLNACSSGALASISYDSFCSQFLLKGAVGLITTAFSVPAPFAARFGCQLVLEYLKAEKTLGEILFAMRQQTLDAHIPIGLFYMMRCPADISLKTNNEEEDV